MDIHSSIADQVIYRLVLYSLLFITAYILRQGPRLKSTLIGLTILYVCALVGRFIATSKHQYLWSLAVWRPDWADWAD